MLRCFARIESAASCSRPSLVAFTSSRCDGTITIHTLPVMIVPTITPTCMYAPRPLNNCPNT
jgi:hypothetical protein